MMSRARAHQKNGYFELARGFAFEIPFIQMMQQVLVNHGLQVYIENEFSAAIYQISHARLMVHQADECPARELMHAFFGPGFLIRLADLYSEQPPAGEI
ncbi:MAG: DUF2007 domain-containing protein [Acidobacteria bacterium]|nr:DUF2007 domain-containing protein [Acidobacteriota bacterium]